MIERQTLKAEVGRQFFFFGTFLNQGKKSGGLWLRVWQGLSGCLIAKFGRVDSRAPEFTAYGGQVRRDGIVFVFSLRNGWISVFFLVFQDCHADSFFSNRGILEGWFNMIIWSVFWLLKIPIGKVSPMMAREVGEVVDRNGSRQLSQLLRRVQTFIRHFNFVQLLGASIDCKELHRFCFFWQQKAENCDQLWSTIFTTDLRPKCFPDDIFSQVLVMNQALQIHHLLALTTTSCSFHLSFLEEWWLEFLKENKLRNVLWVAKSSCFKQLKLFPDFNVSRSFCLTTFQARFDAASIAAATATATRSGLPAEN